MILYKAKEIHGRFYYQVEQIIKRKLKYSLDRGLLRGIREVPKFPEILSIYTRKSQWEFTFFTFSMLFYNICHFLGLAHKTFETLA